jgi:hypothetical protein
MKDFSARRDIKAENGVIAKNSRWDMSSRKPCQAALSGHVGRRGTDALRGRRGMAQNAPMKIAIYMVGALALIVIGSLTWTTMLLGSH